MSFFKNSAIKINFIKKLLNFDADFGWKKKIANLTGAIKVDFYIFFCFDNRHYVCEICLQFFSVNSICKLIPSRIVTVKWIFYIFFFVLLMLMTKKILNQERFFFNLLNSILQFQNRKLIK